MNLPVVSYALPALIALGILQHTKAGRRIPLFHQLRQAAIPRALGKLESIQPVNGGFLEATPLVSFVTMSMAGARLAAHPPGSKGGPVPEGAGPPHGRWPLYTKLSALGSNPSLTPLADS